VVKPIAASINGLRPHRPGYRQGRASARVNSPVGAEHGRCAADALLLNSLNASHHLASRLVPSRPWDTRRQAEVISSSLYCRCTALVAVMQNWFDSGGGRSRSYSAIIPGIASCRSPYPDPVLGGFIGLLSFGRQEPKLISLQNQIENCANAL